MPTARLFLLPLAAVSAICLSSIANAQEREVWACQGIERAGLLWENNQWQVRRFNIETFLLTIDGENSSWKVGSGSETSAVCTKPFYVSCTDTTLGTRMVVLNRDSGLAGFSELFGAAFPPMADVGRDAPNISALNCTKF